SSVPSVPPPMENSIGRTNVSGRHTATVLGSEPLRIVAWRAGWALAEAQVEAGGANVEVHLTLRRGVNVRIEGLEPALAGSLLWWVEVRRPDADRTLIRRQGVNRYAPWTEVRDLEPCECLLELVPVNDTAPGATMRSARVSLHPGGNRVLRADQEMESLPWTG